MEKIKTKKPVVIHNLVKIKALLFLSMRRQTEKRMATARQIAIATGGNADSLYVLLQRWWRWELVRCLDTTPYSYMIADEGLRYLSKIDNWFFSGYYSKKRKKRVPGYRGKVGALKQEIAVASKAVLWWRDTSRKYTRDCPVYYLEAPFTKAENFSKVELPDNRGIIWPKDRLLIVEFDGPVAAYNAIPEWGFKRGNDLGQAIVDARIGMACAKDA